MLPSAQEIAFHQVLLLCIRLSNWPRGPMDEASAYGAGDCRFESYQGHCLDTLLMTSRKEAIMSVIKLLCCTVMLVKKLLC